MELLVLSERGGDSEVHEKTSSCNGHHPQLVIQKTFKRFVHLVYSSVFVMSLCVAFDAK